jgi:hypothetical protein
MTANVKQHFVAQFYLRNFTDPMFSNNLHVYRFGERRWRSNSPKQIGWLSDHYSMIKMDGERSDEFDKFLNRYVEEPGAPAMKKLAMGEEIDADERSAVAAFIALTAARSPQLMNAALTQHQESLSSDARAEQEEIIKCWCELTRGPYDLKAHAAFLKPSQFGAIWVWLRSLQQRLLQWSWNLVRTTSDQPFVTSDRPVFARRWEGGAGIVSFPVSSEVALVFVQGIQFREPPDAVCRINQQTLVNAKDFVAACKDSFPGDDLLKKRDAKGDVS